MMLVFCPLCRIKRRNEDVAVGPVPLRPLDTGDDVELLVQFTVPLFQARLAGVRMRHLRTRSSRMYSLKN